MWRIVVNYGRFARKSIRAKTCNTLHFRNVFSKEIDLGFFYALSYPFWNHWWSLNLIGSRQCDLFTSHTIFFSKLHLLQNSGWIILIITRLYPGPTKKNWASFIKDQICNWRLSCAVRAKKWTKKCDESAKLFQCILIYVCVAVPSADLMCTRFRIVEKKEKRLWTVFSGVVPFSWVNQPFNQFE